MADGLGDSPLGFAGAEAVSYVYAIPVAALAMVVAMLYGRNPRHLDLSVAYSVVAGQARRRRVSWC